MIAAAIAGVILIVVAAIALLGGGSEPSKQASSGRAAGSATAQPTAASKRGSGRSTTVSRGDVQVAVLNGTTINGLASAVQKKLSQAGFGSGPTANFTDQARSASVVFYAGSGSRRAAFEAAKVLNVSDVQPIVDSAKALAPGADVVVVVGADQAP